MRNLNKLKLTSFCLATAFCACKASKPAVTKAETPVVPPVVEVIKPKSACDTLQYTFTRDIKPLVEAHCMPCHGNFSNYEQLKYASKGRAFLGSIMHEQPFHPMPKKANKLSDSTIQVFQCWIENGQKL